MSDLEHLVRRSLARDAAAAPGASELRLEPSGVRHRSRPVLLALAAAVAVALVLVTSALVAGAGDDVARPAGHLVRPDTHPTPGSEIPPDERGVSVDLSGTDLQGHPVDLRDYRGEPVVISVWGPWCGPCAAHAGSLVSVAHHLEGTARFLGVDVDDVDPAAGRAYEREHAVPYPSIYSRGRSVLDALATSVHIPGVPALVVLDGQGRVAAILLGGSIDGSTIEHLVTRIAAEGSGVSGCGEITDIRPLEARWRDEPGSRVGLDSSQVAGSVVPGSDRTIALRASEADVLAAGFNLPALRTHPVPLGHAFIIVMNHGSWDHALLVPSPAFGTSKTFNWQIAILNADGSPVGSSRLAAPDGPCFLG